MEGKGLDDALRALVRQYGIESIERTLRRIREAFLHRGENEMLTARSTEHTPRKPRSRRPRITAVGYVSKLQVSTEMQAALWELAQKFENRTFLPTLGDIRNFCLIYGIEPPASHSRTSAIPRIFGQLAQLAPAEIQSVIQADSYSGPSRLAPIADAIRRRSEQRARLDPTAPRSIGPGHETSEMEREAPSKPQLPSKF